MSVTGTWKGSYFEEGKETGCSVLLRLSLTEVSGPDFMGYARDDDGSEIGRIRGRRSSRHISFRKTTPLAVWTAEDGRRRSVKDLLEAAYGADVVEALPGQTFENQVEFRGELIEGGKRMVGTFRVTPKMIIGPDGKSILGGEAKGQWEAVRVAEEASRV